MSKKQIENPKVFISYAWGTKEYQNKVLSLATDLVGDGVDVILDKWSLKEGNDTYAFMEQSVSDDTVTNVLLLLDPQYEEKANCRSGGVGTETQIISAEIYNKVKQDKFLPVVFERYADNTIPKPIYLKSLLHFDLSDEETYDTEYQRLVRTLYGIEVYKKPKLGKKPDWLETVNTVSTKTRTTFDVLKTNISEKMKSEKFTTFLAEIENKIIDYGREVTASNYTHEQYIQLYSETASIRNEYLNLVQYSSYIENSEKLIASNLEEICERLMEERQYGTDIRKTLLHEIFIYIIAIYYKNKNYRALSYILTKTYFVRDAYNKSAQSFNIFYNNDEYFDGAINERDNKKYYSGTAHYWIEFLNTEICSKQDFVFADILLHNVSIYSNNYLDDWYWFPLTYVYGGEYNKSMRNFANKLCSTEHLIDAALIMGYENVDEFKKRFIEIENRYQNGAIRSYSYNSAFESAPLLCHYIKSSDLGKYK